VSRLRLFFVGVLSALAVVAAPAGAGTGHDGVRSVSSRASLDRAILVEINALRTSRGLRPVVQSAPLADAARSHSFEMARIGYFAHDSASGSTFTQRVQGFYASSGYRSWRAGENLLWASPDVSAKQALELWRKSPEHRKILFAPGWRDIGVSAVHTPAGPRAFDGLAVTIVTANFGARVR
jgi:uncharacterized protein YkwD